MAHVSAYSASVLRIGTNDLTTLNSPQHLDFTIYSADTKR
jgi:hypothetical protein